MIYEGLTAEVLARAARRPDAPPRLLRTADAVLDGKFSWAEVASGQCAHPLAQSLFTPKASVVLRPLLAIVANEVAAEKMVAPAPQQPSEQPARNTRRNRFGEDFSDDDHVRNDLYEGGKSRRKQR